MLAVLGSFNYIKKRQRAFYALMLLLEAGVVGVFCATDLFLFYVFFELTLVPMYFIVGVWGGERRIYAAIKFFLFTAFGSLLMLVGILYLFFKAKTLLGIPTFAYADLLQVPLTHEGAALAVHRVRSGLLGEGPGLPAPHLASRRPRGGADAGLRRPGRRAPEDGDLRLPPVPAPALPGGGAAPHGGDGHDGRWGSSASSTRRGWRPCSPTPRSWWPTPRWRTWASWSSASSPSR